MNAITDQPALVVGLVRAALAVVVAFWPGLFTPQQTEVIIGLAVAMLALSAVTVKTTVPKTPSSIDGKTLQTPPSGTILVTTAAAHAKSAVPAGSVVAGPTP